MARKRITEKVFLERATATHGNLYDYSRMAYINYKDKVEIVCSIHGSFQQSPHHHIQYKQGCFSCGRDQFSITHKEKSFLRFLEKAKKCHGDKYDYSRIVWKGTERKVEIICPIHGSFWQGTSLHCRCGCQLCGKEKHRQIAIQKARNKFKKQASTVHNNKYNYDLSEYINTKTPVKIICPHHGIFEQPPKQHLRGTGCPYCHHFVSKPETAWLDSLNIPNDKDHRNAFLIINKRRFRPDGFMPETKIVYEFNGDYYHGNPAVFNPEDINASNGKKFKELYNKTLEREQALKEAGYTVISIWEADYYASLKLPADNATADNST